MIVIFFTYSMETLYQMGHNTNTFLWFDLFSICTTCFHPYIIYELHILQPPFHEHYKLMLRRPYIFKLIIFVSAHCSTKLTSFSPFSFWIARNSITSGGGMGGIASSADSLGGGTGTPSRLSIGSGWASTPGHTWATHTEGTPSYTPSSLSRDSSLSVGGSGRASAHAAGQSSFDDVCDVCPCWTLTSLSMIIICIFCCFERDLVVETCWALCQVTAVDQAIGLQNGHLFKSDINIYTSIYTL